MHVGMRVGVDVGMRGSIPVVAIHQPSPLGVGAAVPAPLLRRRFIFDMRPYGWRLVASASAAASISAVAVAVAVTAAPFSRMAMVCLKGRGKASEANRLLILSVCLVAACVKSIG